MRIPRSCLFGVTERPRWAGRGPDEVTGTLPRADALRAVCLGAPLPRASDLTWDVSVTHSEDGPSKGRHGQGSVGTLTCSLVRVSG